MVFITRVTTCSSQNSPVFLQQYWVEAAASQGFVRAKSLCLRRLQDPELLRFIDIECYCWSTVLADFTPMINSGMVFCDRHFGGINYPRVRERDAASQV